MNTGFLGHAVATVLTVYGIETCFTCFCHIGIVATVLTVYGIETLTGLLMSSSVKPLQQYLPFTVLKLITWSL